MSLFGLTLGIRGVCDISYKIKKKKKLLLLSNNICMVGFTWLVMNYYKLYKFILFNPKYKGCLWYSI